MPNKVGTPLDIVVLVTVALLMGSPPASSDVDCDLSEQSGER
jgi:hypothetical protein